jgi:P-type Ca2+ transporter type 2C
MTVVEAYVGGSRLEDVGDTKMMSTMVSSLLMEGIAQNTTGSVFEPEVSLFRVCVHLQWP